MSVFLGVCSYTLSCAARGLEHFLADLFPAGVLFLAKCILFAVGCRTSFTWCRQDILHMMLSDVIHNTLSVFLLWAVCKMNIHKRCQRNVANNCGTNTRDMAQILQEMGISWEKLGPQRGPRSKKVHPFCVSHVMLVHNKQCCSI